MPRGKNARDRLATQQRSAPLGIDRRACLVVCLRMLSAVVMSLCLNGKSPAELEVRSDVALGNLKSPQGVCIRPRSESIFYVDTGALVVGRLDHGSMAEVITHVDEPEFVPRSAVFLSPNDLAVGFASNVSDELVRVYRLANDPKLVLQADGFVSSHKIASASASDHIQGVSVRQLIGDLHRIFLRVAVSGQKSIVLSSIVVHGNVGDFAKLIQIDAHSPISDIDAICLSPQKEVVVAGTDSTTQSNAALIFFDPAEGRILRAIRNRSAVNFRDRVQSQIGAAVCRVSHERPVQNRGRSQKLKCLPIESCFASKRHHRARLCRERCRVRVCRAGRRFLQS